MARRADANIYIQFKPLGLDSTTALLNRHFGKMKGRTQYYMGMIQSRIGYAFLGASAAMTAFGVASVKGFAQFDQAIMNAVSVMKDGRENMEKLRETALRLGATMPMETTKIANALYYMGSAGWNAEQSMEALEPAMKLAIATQHDLVASTRFLMFTLNQWGEDADKAGEYANIMAAGIESSQLRVEWLGEALGNIGPIANALGVSLKKVTAHLMLLHDAGIKGSKAGRHLRIIYTRLLNPIGRGKKALAELGLTVKDVTIKTHEVAEALEALKKAGIDEAQVMDMFRQRSGASVMALLNNTDAIKKNLKALDDLMALQKMYDIQMEGLQMRFKQIGTAFDVFSKKLTLAFKPIIDMVIVPITKLVKLLAKLPKGLLVIIGLVSAFGALYLAVAGVTFVMLGLFTQGQFTYAMLGKLFAASFMLGNPLRKLHILFWTLGFQATHAGKSFKFAWRATSKMTDKVKIAKYQNAGLAASFRILTASVFRFLGALAALAIKVLAIIAVFFLFISVVTLIRLALKKVETGFGEVFLNIIKGIPVLGHMVLLWSKLEKLLPNVASNIKKAIPEWGSLAKQVLLSIPIFGQFFAMLMKINAVTGRGPKALKAMEDATRALAKENKETMRLLFQSVNETINEFEGLGQKTWEKITATTENAIQTLMKLFGLAREEAEALAKSIQKIGDTTDKSTNKIKEHLLALNKWSKVLATKLYGEFKEKAEAMDEYKDKLVDSWTGVIKSLIDGSKTWRDVWNQILDDALTAFIKGFLTRMVTSWGAALADMAFQAQATQLGLGGGFADILGVLGSLFGMGGTTSKGAVTTSAGVANAMSGGFAEGGIATKPTLGVFGEAGPEALIPLDKMKGFGQQEITIVNVVDPSFVPAALQKDPRVIVNIINQDVIQSGSTRKVLRRNI